MLIVCCGMLKIDSNCDVIVSDKSNWIVIVADIQGKVIVIENLKPMYMYVILATANMQLGQEMGLVMQTMHSTDSIPIVSTNVCFLPLKLYTGITKILEFEYKTDMF